MNASELQNQISAFSANFGRKPEAAAFAPGRVNLIGEHTDYNDGFVLPMAVDMGVCALAAKRTDGRVRAASREFSEAGEFGVGDRIRSNAWHDAVKGVLMLLEQRGAPLPGLDLYVAGDLPAESGLSSSAAYIVSLVTALFHLAGISVTSRETATAARRVENEFIGTPCGILDQMASAACREGHALLLDCRDLSSQDIPLPAGTSILVGNTGVRRKLASGKYEERVRECAAAVKALQTQGENVRSLRDATEAMLLTHGDAMSGIALRRARHVVSENARVIQSAAALRSGDLVKFGLLMNDSHASLRNDYEVSCPELDAMVRALSAQNGVLGARLVGAGFGGCAIALLHGEIDKRAIASASEIYRSETGRDGAFYVVHPGAGARIIE